MQSDSSGYALLIFDWDGTLMDSTPKIVSSVQQAARRSRLPVPDTAAVKDIIGLSLPIALKRLFQSVDDKQLEQLVEHYRDEFVCTNSTPSPMFDGAIALLERLHQRGQAMAVATGKMRRGLLRSWQQSGTERLFVTSRCADEAQSKPSPDMLEQILQERGLSANQALMIGDTEHDMKMAQAINMPRIGVSYGAQGPERLLPYQPLTVLDDITQLAGFLGLPGDIE